MNRRRAADEPVRRHSGLPPEVFNRFVQAVPMQAAAERYGLNPDRRGKTLQPASPTLAERFVRLAEQWFPDAYIFVLLSVVIVAAAAMFL